MKNTLLTAGAVILLTAAAPAQDATPNFTGKWSVDIAKSDFGPMPPPESLVHVIDHQEPNLKIATSQKGAQGETTNERLLTTDGKENLNKVRMGSPDLQEVKSTSKWNGKALATSFKVDFQGNSLEIHDSWKLSDDGKVLTIVREFKSAQGEFAATTVFNKQ